GRLPVVSALNASARTKPHLILVALLLKETVIIWTSSGPCGWARGCQMRKTAYVYTLLDTCFAKLELPTFLGRSSGLMDDSDKVKVIIAHGAFKLSQVAPAAVSQKLD
ncbi:hypothetical protein C8J57DRAFT_567613, partial [Mycena rebaudengoi]